MTMSHLSKWSLCYSEPLHRSSWHAALLPVFSLIPLNVFIWWPLWLLCYFQFLGGVFLHVPHLPSLPCLSFACLSLYLIFSHSEFIFRGSGLVLGEFTCLGLWKHLHTMASHLLFRTEGFEILFFMFAVWYHPSRLNCRPQTHMVEVWGLLYFVLFSPLLESCPLPFGYAHPCL